MFTAVAKAKLTIFFVHSQQTASEIFTVEGFDPLTVVEDKNKHTVGGRIVVRSCIDRKKRVGYVTKETTTKLTVQMVNRTHPASLVVPKPTFDRSLNDGNGGYQFQADLNHEGYSFEVVQYDPLRFQYDHESMKLRFLLNKMFYRGSGRPNALRYKLFEEFCS